MKTHKLLYVQHQVVSPEIIDAFSTELVKLSIHFTNPHRIAAGASDTETGFSPLEHWEALHAFLRVRFCWILQALRT